MLLLRFFLLLFIAIGFAKFVKAQTTIEKFYTTSNGLGSNWTYGIVQDDKGFIWVSSDKGIARFDGTSFTNYDIQDGLTDNQVIKLFKDSKGRIWLSNLNGTIGYIFENKIYNQKQNNIFSGTENIKGGAYFSEGRDGEIYQNAIIGSNILYKYSKAGVNKLELKLDAKDRVWFVVNKNDKLYYQTFDGLVDAETQKVQYYNGLYVYKNSSTLTTITVDFKNSRTFFIDSIGVSVCIPGDSVYNIIDFRRIVKPSAIRNFNYTPNNLWISSAAGGIYRYTYSQEKGWYYNGYLLKGYDINYAFADKLGNFWFSTNFNGLVYLPAYYNQISVINAQNGLANNNCYSIIKANGTLFVGGDNCKVYTINNNKYSNTITVQKGNFGSNQVFKLIANNTDLYAAFINGTTRINLNNYTSQKISYRKVKDKDGTYLISNNMPLKSMSVTNQNKIFISGGVLDYIEKEEKDVFVGLTAESKGRSYYHYQDNEGNILISTSKGLCKIVDTNYVPFNENIAIFKTPINAIIQLQNGAYIMGAPSGIYLYNKIVISDSICNKTLLPGVNCKKLLSVNNTIWALMENGVVELIVKENKISIGRRFTLGNGLLSHTPLDIEADENNLYIATLGGVYTINKNIESNNFNTNAVITEVVNDSIEYTYDKYPTIPYSSKPLRISFDILSYGISEKKEFRYRIVGQTDWIAINSNSIELVELKHGDTKIEVMGRLAGSDWGEVAQYQFFYKKPIYRRKGFQFAALIGLFLGAFLIYRKQQKKVQQEANEKHEMKHKITSLENQALQSLMHPHFVFNSLNSIQHYINSNDTQNANRYLSRFAKLIRLNLNSGINGFITIEDEMERLGLYLSLEQLRFEDKLKYTINCDKSIEIDELYLPSMILQPFIENALWHGILNKGEVGTITININQPSEEQITVSVADDGIGIKNAQLNKKDKKHQSKGLQLIDTRLALLSDKYDKTFAITKTEAEPENQKFPGHKVELSMPTLYEEDVKK